MAGALGKAHFEFAPSLPAVTDQYGTKYELGLACLSAGRISLRLCRRYYLTTSLITARNQPDIARI